MPKSEKLFEMVRYIKEYPGLNAAELSRLCDVSERGIYRYINTLKRAGIMVRFRKDGYYSDSDTGDFLSRFNAEERRDVRAGLALLAKNTKDPAQQYRCTEAIQEIDRQYPNLENGRQLMEIVAPGVAPQQMGGSIVIGHGSIPLDINPLTTTNSISANLLKLIFSSLVRVDAENNAVPDLAEKWTVSEDGLVWTFYLRNNVTFHDGHPLTAEDVVFTYRSLLNSGMAQRHDFIEDILSPADYVVTMKLKYPRSTMFGFNRSIVPKHILADGNISAAFGRKPVGSGPFVMSKWAKDNTITLDRNPNYYEPNRPILDQIIFTYLPNQTSASQAMSDSTVDLIFEMASSDIDVLNSAGVFRVYAVPDNTYYVLNLNVQKPPFDDVRVRRALAYAVDRQSLMNRQLKGNSQPCNGPFPANDTTYDQSVTESMYDPEKARSLLHECGWRTNEKGELIKGDKRFEFIIGIVGTTDVLNRLGYAIRGQLAKIGVTTKIAYLKDPAEAVDGCDSLLAKQPYGLHSRQAALYWSSIGCQNTFSYSNDVVDNLLEQNKREVDSQKRELIYNAINRILQDEQPAIFLATGCGYIGSKYNLSSVLESPFYIMDNLKDLQIQQVAQTKADSPATQSSSD